MTKMDTTYPRHEERRTREGLENHARGLTNGERSGPVEKLGIAVPEGIGHDLKRVLLVRGAKTKQSASQYYSPEHESIGRTHLMRICAIAIAEKM